MEIWDSYDREGRLTGEKLIRGESIPEGWYHLVCDVLVRHRDGSYLCMKRSVTKAGYPGWLEATAGGSALAGEDAYACARRELREETGIKTGDFMKIGESRNRNTLYHTFLCTVDCDKTAVTLQEGETEAFFWFNEAEFIEFVNSENMIPLHKRRYDSWLRKMGYVQEKKIFLVRHGADDETIRGGWSQHSLTEEGFRQAEELGEFVHWNLNAAHLYSSDLCRAVQTADPVADNLGLSVRLLPQFRETNNGELAGMKHELACARYPGLYWNTLGWEEKYPGGESPRDFYERIRDAWEEFQVLALRNEGNSMLVTHGGVINVILSLVTGKPYSNKKHRWKIRHTQIIALTYRDGRWEIDDDK